MAYDFSGLAPADFEALCADLIAREIDLPLQPFATGRDKGIDLRYAPAAGRDCIIQCKHFVRSGFSKLRSHLAQKELPKIKSLNPGRYILATSVGLTPSNVDRLFALLSPYCKSKHDIIGADQLNALLRAHPDIERSHFKLWLTSEPVLSRVLHNEVFVQSYFTEDHIRQRLGLYVYTDAFDKARGMLVDRRVCILSGVPGVGKTTLAEMLLVDYMMDDWQIITIQQNISEAQRLYGATKQVFYYDDFLGQISSGEKLHKNEDRALLNLIDTISKSPNKRFVLTTREYILAQAKEQHEQLSRSTIDLFRFVVTCEDYSDVDKAKILANHLYFAEVPQSHIAALVKGKAYQGIISHRNYSPRIVEWLTSVSGISQCRPAHYPAVFKEKLDNPADLWRHAFDNQISEGARHVLMILGSCGDYIFIRDLKRAFEQFHIDQCKRYGHPVSRKSFESALNEMEGNFIRIDRSEADLVVSCHNPSVMDFLKFRMTERMDDTIEIVNNAVYFEQVERLFQVFGLRECDDNDICGIAFQNAICRTLDCKGVILTRTGSLRWIRSSCNIWERLNTCVRIGDAIENTELRQEIEKQIDKRLREKGIQQIYYEQIVSLLFSVDGSTWIDMEIVRQWRQMMWNELREMVPGNGGSVEDLSALASWFVGYRNDYDPQQAEAIEENLVSAVVHEIDYNRGDDADELSSQMARVEEISEALGCNFSEEIKQLQEELNRCADPDDDYDFTSRSHHSEKSSSSIESLFDSLLE